MKFNELQLGIEYAVIPAWDYSSKDKKNPALVQRRDVVKASLVSLDKYEYKVFRSDNPSDPNFAPAPKGSRVVGYMVKNEDINSQQFTYFLARPQDIVAPYDQLEQRWEREEKERAESERKAQLEREQRERIVREATEREQRILNGIKESLVLILGEERANKTRLEVTNRRNANGDYLPHGELTLDSRIAQLLLEKVLEAKDLVG